MILRSEKKRYRSCESSADDCDVVDVPVILGEDDPAEAGDSNDNIEKVKDGQAEVNPICRRSDQNREREV